MYWKQSQPPGSKTKLMNFYTPLDEQHEWKLTFIGLGGFAISGVVYYFER